MNIFKKKLRGGALLFALIISVLILILTSSIISINHYYSVKYAFNERLNILKNNAESALNLALSENFPESSDKTENTIDLFGDGNDSVKISRWNFGLFDGFAIEAHYKNIVIEKKALAGYEFGEGSVFYLADHGRHVSIAGKTEFYERVFFPKAGLQAGTISGNSAIGEPVRGMKYVSKELPKLNKMLEQKIENIFNGQTTNDSVIAGNVLMVNDSIINSFANPTLKISLRGDFTISDKYIDGNILIQSSGKIRIRKNTSIKNAIIIARFIEFEKETQICCQAFARDTILTGEKCVFNYPSAFVLLEEKNRPAFLSLGKENAFNGSIIGLRDKNTINVPFSFSMGENSALNGQLYFSGPADLKGEINGEIYLEQSFVNTGSAVYDNFLYNVAINKNKLNKRFCYTQLFDETSIRKKQKRSLLKWIL